MITFFLLAPQVSASRTPQNVENRVENVVILHTNDLHGHLLSEGEKGGSAYIASIVDNERDYHPGRVIVLDAGDIVDGAPIGDLFNGRSVVDVMNTIGYDVMTVGNHELAKYGRRDNRNVIPIDNDYLLDLRENAEFPMLAANVRINESMPFLPYVIENVQGVEIGIIGVTTSFWSPENMEIWDNYENVVQQYIWEIENDVDVTIALTHLGKRTDESLASNVDNLDIIIGGHSHTIMRSPENLGGTMIVQAGSEGKYVGRICMGYDVENSEIDGFSYNLIEVKHPPLAENKVISELIGYYDNTISPIVDVRVGYTASALATGENVAESFKIETGAEVGFQNYGGVRAEINAGGIMVREVHKALPYANKLMSMDLRGDYLKSEFDYGYVAGAYQESGNWYLENEDLIENDEYYRVATNEYSGTRYDFIHGKNITYHGLCRNAFLGYLEETYPYSPVGGVFHPADRERLEEQGEKTLTAFLVPLAALITFLAFGFWWRRRK